MCVCVLLAGWLAGWLAVRRNTCAIRFHSTRPSDIEVPRVPTEGTYLGSDRYHANSSPELHDLAVCHSPSSIHSSSLPSSSHCIIITGNHRCLSLNILVLNILITVPRGYRWTAHAAQQLIYTCLAI